MIEKLKWPGIVVGFVAAVVILMNAFGFSFSSVGDRVTVLEDFMAEDDERIQQAIEPAMAVQQEMVGDLTFLVKKAERDDCRQAKIGEYGNTGAGKLRALEFCTDSLSRAWSADGR